jgi:hypothetical protein
MMQLDSLSQLWKKRSLRPALLALSFCCAGVFAAAQQQMKGPATPPPPVIPAGPGPAKGGGGLPVVPMNFEDHTGFVQIFDGKTLKNWDGAPGIWRVEDGAIVGESKPDNPSGTTFIIWKGGQPSNFDLKLELKYEGPGNSGVQYRSHISAFPPPRGGRGLTANDELFRKEREKWNLAGYQMDFRSNNDNGTLYEMFGRGWINPVMGQIVSVGEGKPPQLIGHGKSPEELLKIMRPDGWNQYEIIASGNTLMHIVNGEVTSVTIDNDLTKRAFKGVIGIEIETRGSSKVEARDIWLKNLP